jgi:peptidoglycan/xylan/chitin deacetylase (PgdA/CDA1 family)
LPNPLTRYRPVGCQATGGPRVVFEGTKLAARRRDIALTFDDGPWADTPEFVSLLEKEKVPGTFFMIGDQVTSVYQKTLLRSLRNGNALGDHTLTHPDLVATGNAYYQISTDRNIIRALTGYSPCVFRAPYGSYDSQVLATAYGLGMTTIQWNVDPSDWARPSTSVIVSRVLEQVRAGSIIISHDGGGNREETLAAYKQLIPILKARGYHFLTVPQILGYRPTYRRCVKLCSTDSTTTPPKNAILLNG